MASALEHEVRLPFPPLSPGQAAAVESKTRFTVVSGGAESGKTTLAIDVLLTHEFGALAGYPVLLIAPDDERLLRVRRRILMIVDALLLPAKTQKGKQGVIELTTGGQIHLASVQDALRWWGQVALLVIDDAALIDGLISYWETFLEPLLTRHRGHAYFFSKPRGATNDFGRLVLRSDPDWSRRTLTTADNPTCDLDAFLRESENMEARLFLQERLGEVLAAEVVLSRAQMLIGPEETFLDWCDRLESEAVRVDGHLFTLRDRPALRYVYGLIPSTPEQAFRKVLVLMKCAQVGFTVMEMLACLYFALKWSPCKVGMYLPDRSLAAIKSSDRFLPIVRTIPAVHALMTETAKAAGKGGEGNILVRSLGDSMFLFGWTSGAAMTESVPLDVLSFDEVQNMALSDMEKTGERMSASRIRYTLMGSTANALDADIHAHYKRGNQHRFWTECPSCGEHQVLDDHFPACVGYDEARRDYRYRCHACLGWIDDPQRGEWRQDNPEALIDSLHFPQFLSPTITPRDMIEAFHNAEDLKNFYNRKLGKPYNDPSQMPINLEMLNACAQLGQSLGVVWRDRGAGCYMGIDQMGAYNVVLVAERLASGHMALIYAEEVYSDDPFSRCDELMAAFAVAVCVLEQLPNFNDAHRFAKRHPGRVFLVNYAQMADEWVRWGDAVPTQQEHKTDDEERMRHTVTIDQYRAMDLALSRIKRQQCVFPDPAGLVQEVLIKGERMLLPILKDRVFLHFTKTALVVIEDAEEKKFRRAVKKVGIDPHFSYAFMLLSVAWVRAHGTSMFLFPEATVANPAEPVPDLPGLPEPVQEAMAAPLLAGTCGGCLAFDPETGRCRERGFIVAAGDAGCWAHVPA